MKLNFKLQLLSLSLVAAAFLSGCNTKNNSDSLASLSGSQRAQDSAMSNDRQSRNGVNDIALSDAYYEQTDTDTFQRDLYENAQLYDGFRSQECDALSASGALPPAQAAFHCLRKICSLTPGAHFDENNKECLCGPTSVFRSENNQGHCLLVTLEQSAGMPSFMPMFPDHGTTLVNYDLKPIVFTQVDANDSISHQLFSSPYRFKSNFLANTKYVAGPLPASSSDKSRLAQNIYYAAFAPPQLDSGMNLFFLPSVQSYYEPEASLLMSAMGYPEALADMTARQRADFFSVSLPSADIVNSNPVAHAIAEIVRQGLLGGDSFSASGAELISGAGCSEYCVVSRAFSTSVDQEYQTRFEKVYYLGAKINSRISIQNRRTGNLAAVVLLNAGGGISSVLLMNETSFFPITYSQTPNHRQFDVGSLVGVYDRHWNKISYIGFNFVSDLEKTLTTLSNTAHSYEEQVREKNKGAIAAICEPWTYASHNQMLLGPHFQNDLSHFRLRASTEPLADILGWGDRSSLNYNHYIGSSLDDGHWIHLDHADPHHPLDVANTFVDGDANARFIPLGARNGCMAPETYPTWKRQLQEAGARVVSLSFAKLLSRSICEQKYSSIFNDPQSPFLYVAGAGNDGWLSNRLICPQNVIAKSKNGIVVAALSRSTPDHLAPYSNFGVDAVDIAAEIPQNPRLLGTSFSAPKVAKVAADLFRLYPHFTPAQVRLAIILGARIPSLENPLPVRSGGVLDSSHSLEFARLIHNALQAGVASSEMESFRNVSSFINTVYCEQDHACEIANKKISILQNNKFFEMERP